MTGTLRPLPGRVFASTSRDFEFTYLTDLAMPALIERLKHLPDHTIVYHTSHHAGCRRNALH